jgi:ATP-binding cassette, subfamily B, bacterial
MARPPSLATSLPGLRRLLLRFRPYLRRQRSLVAGAFVALFAEVALRLLEPWPLKFVFDHVLGASPATTGDGSGVGRTLAFAAGAVVLLAAGRALTAYLSTVGFALAGQRALTEVRGDLFRHVQRLSLDFHGRARDGDLILRVIGDVGMVRDVVVTAALPLLGNVLILLGMIAVMFWMNAELALLGIAVLPLFWLRSVRLGRRIREVSREQRSREGAMAATASEALGGIRAVQALSLEHVFDEAFAAQNRRSLRDGARSKRLQARLERSVDVLTAAATALVLWYGAELVLAGTLTPGDLLVFLAYLKNAYKPIRDFAKYTARLSKAAAAGERILELLDEPAGISDRPGALSVTRVRGSIHFENVSFSYADGTPVLRAIDFEIAPGELVALVGRSGIGKSTIAGLMLRLHDPQHGRILLDDRDLREYTLDSLRGRVATALQDSTLFAVSVHDNIAFGAPGCSTADVEAAARLVNAHEFISALPDGYATVLGERGVTLSSGQRQRIALARAAIRRADIVLLDEPTTGLDETNERAVVAGIEKLAQAATTLLITHDLRLAARADRILVLDDGRIIEEGTHDELLNAHGAYATLYRLQAGTRPARVRGLEPHAASA